MGVSEINIYNIGYYSHEESSYVQLIHDQKYSETEFKNIIFKAVENVLRKMKDKEIELIPLYFSFQSIFDNVIEELINSFGFRKLEYTASWDCFGWPSILNEKDWPNDRESLKELTEYLHEHGFTPESMNERHLIWAYGREQS